jgi:hypothetical protein
MSKASRSTGVWNKKNRETQIVVDADTLVMDSAAGLTLWLDKPLSGAYRISFTREVMMQNRPHDRLSDVNLFWAASDPANPELFTRSGKLNEYDRLELYYAGIGGNWNTTTRFRHYDGHGERRLLAEFTEPERLLRPHHAYHIVIEVTHGATRVLVDGEQWFSAAFTSPRRLATLLSVRFGHGRLSATSRSRNCNLALSP